MHFAKIVKVFPTGRSGGAYQTSYPSELYGVNSLVKTVPVRQNRTIGNHLGRQAVAKPFRSSHESSRGIVAMRALGIGLMIFNLLLTIAIGAYLAPTAWSKRQEMNATVAKAYLVKVGLPVDAPKYDANSSTQPISFSTTGGHVVESVGTEMLAGYFGNDTPVNSQKEELEKAYNAMQSTIAGMNSPADVMGLLAGSYSKGQFSPGLLTLMSRTYSQRAEVRSLIRAPNEVADANQLQKAVEAAKKILAQRYEEVKAAKTELETKDRIAHFLAYLNPQSDTHQKRVILVVGMRQYMKMLGDQSASYDEIARRVSRKIELDQEFYVQEYEMLKKLAIDRAQLASSQKAVEIELASNKNDDDTSYNARVGQKTARLQELDNVQNAVKKLLDSNAALESKLQETQRTVGQLLDSILAEEAKLEAAERAASGKP